MHSSLPSSPARQTGFTLTELAIVLVIMSLLSGGILLSLSAQAESRHLNDTRQQLGEIKDALLGFAAANGYLPCPDVDTDPGNTSYGVSDNTSCSSGEGWLPFKTLGTYEHDPWGSHRTQAGDPPQGRWRYRLDSAYGSTISLATSQADGLAVVDRSGNALTNSGDNKDRPIAIIYSTGPDGIANGRNGDTTGNEYAADIPGPGFDDQLLWISRPLLFNRLIAAGRQL